MGWAPKRNTKRDYASMLAKISVFFLAIALCAAIFPLLPSTTHEEVIVSSENWWNTSWLYRKPLDLSNVIIGHFHVVDITVYKPNGHDDIVAGTIDCEGHCQHNFSDIRFVTPDKESISFWIEEINEGEEWAKIWVNVSDNDQLYMYYGNQYTSSTSDATATFSIFEDAESYENDTINPDGWSVLQYKEFWTRHVKATNLSPSSASYGSQVIEVYGSEGRQYDSCWVKAGKTFNLPARNYTLLVDYFPDYAANMQAPNRRMRIYVDDTSVYYDALSSSSDMRTWFRNVQIDIENQTITALKFHVEGWPNDVRNINTYASIGFDNIRLFEGGVVWENCGSEETHSCPSLTNPSPSCGQTDVSLNPTIAIAVTDRQGDLQNLTFSTNVSGSWETIGYNQSTPLSNGTYQQYTASMNSPSTTYWWRVHATDATGHWTTGTYQFTTRARHVVFPPSILTATTHNRTTIDLSWATGDNATHTYIERNSVESWNRGQGTTVYNGTGTSTSDTNLYPGTTYYYQAWGWDDGDQVWSLTAKSTSAMTHENRAPIFSLESPTNGSSGMEINTSTVTVTIRDPDGDRFNWTITSAYATTAEGTREQNGSKSATLVSPLPYNTSISWTVTATDGYGELRETYAFTTTRQFSWWDNNWRYAKKLTAGTIPDDQLMKLTVFYEDGRDNVSSATVDCEGHCNEGFSDLRFSTVDGNALDYFISETGIAGGGGFSSDFESSSWKDDWNDNGATDWDRTSKYCHGGSYAVEGGRYDSYLTSDDIDTTSFDDEFVISFWYYDNNVPVGDDAYLQYWDGDQYDTIFNLGSSDEGIWHEYSQTITDLQYFSSDFHIRFDVHNVHGSSENIYLDDVDVSPLQHYATVWVDTSGEQTIYIYYGNSDATNASSVLSSSTEGEWSSFGEEQTNTWPQLSSPSPARDAEGISLNPLLSIDVTDPQGNLENITFLVSDNGEWDIVESHVGTPLSNGTYMATPSTMNEHATSYQWCVRAQDMTGYWANATYGFTTREAYLPAPPSSFTAVAYNTTRIDIEWTKGTNASHTYIERNSVESWNRGQGTMIYNGTGTTKSDTGLPEGTTYYYRAWSYNETDILFSQSSVITSARTTGGNEAPQQTNPFPAQEETSISLGPTLRITISDQEGDGLDVYFRTNASGSWTTIGSNTSIHNGTYRQQTNDMDSYLTMYWWSINLTDGSSWTNETYTFTTKGNDAPIQSNPSPTNGATAVALNPTLKITISDDGSDELTLYFRKNASGNWDTLQAYEGKSSGTYSVSSTDMNSYETKYWWSVNLTDGVNWNNKTYRFTTRQSEGGGGPSPPPSPPSNGDEEEDEQQKTKEQMIEELYDIVLSTSFYVNDTDGDGKVDSFIDPNGLLHAERWLNISRHTTLLLSVEEELQNIFLWDIEDDSISEVSYEDGSIVDTLQTDDTLIVSVVANKTEWLYLEIIDEYSEYMLLYVTTADGRMIDKDMIWREGTSIYIFDDPSTTYVFTYLYEAPSFLFDVIIELATDSVYQGETINAIITQINVGETGLVNGTLEYAIVHNDEMIWTDEENVSVVGQKAFSKEIETSELEPGSYLYAVTFRYGSDQTASAQVPFTVKSHEESMGGIPLEMIILGAILAVILLSGILWWFGIWEFPLEWVEEEEEQEQKADIDRKVDKLLHLGD